MHDTDTQHLKEQLLLVRTPMCKQKEQCESLVHLLCCVVLQCNQIQLHFKPSFAVVRLFENVINVTSLRQEKGVSFFNPYLMGG